MPSGCAKQCTWARRGGWSGEGEHCGYVGISGGVITWRMRGRDSCSRGAYLPPAGTQGVLSFQQTWVWAVCVCMCMCVCVCVDLAHLAALWERENMQRRQDKLLSIHSTHWHTFIHQFTCTSSRMDALSCTYSTLSHTHTHTHTETHTHTQTHTHTPTCTDNGTAQAHLRHETKKTWLNDWIYSCDK